jgi:hypothetical protein
MMMWFVCNRRNALALVEYHHGAVPAVLDELGAASAAVRTIPRYGLIIRHIHVTPGHYLSAALAFDFHFCISTLLVSFSITPAIAAKTFFRAIALKLKYCLKLSMLI